MTQKVLLRHCSYFNWNRSCWLGVAEHGDLSDQTILIKFYFACPVLWIEYLAELNDSSRLSWTFQVHPTGIIEVPSYMERNVLVVSTLQGSCVHCLGVVRSDLVGRKEQSLSCLPTQKCTSQCLFVPPRAWSYTRSCRCRSNWTSAIKSFIK